MNGYQTYLQDMAIKITSTAANRTGCAHTFSDRPPPLCSLGTVMGDLP